MDYFGYNDGDPWTSPKSAGVLKGVHNVLNFPCSDVNRTVPYFKEFTPE